MEVMMESKMELRVELRMELLEDKKGFQIGHCLQA